MYKKLKNQSINKQKFHNKLKKHKQKNNEIIIKTKIVIIMIIMIMMIIITLIKKNMRKSESCRALYICFALEHLATDTYLEPSQSYMVVRFYENS